MSLLQSKSAVVVDYALCIPYGDSTCFLYYLHRGQMCVNIGLSQYTIVHLHILAEKYQ